jgi:hypothetical protein
VAALREARPPRLAAAVAPLPAVAAVARVAVVVTVRSTAGAAAMNPMHQRHSEGGADAFPGAMRALVLAAAIGLPALAQAQAPFATPEQATEALIEAVAVNDPGRLPHLLGKDWRQVLPLEDIAAEDRYLFLEKAHQSRVVEVKDGRAELTIGSDPWTMPIPLEKGADGQWRFDPIGAKEEIRARRIGANERAAIQAVLAYVDAQKEYASADRNGDGLLEYAQKLNSSPGKRDGLIWSPSLGDESPLGEAYLPARPGEGYHGYRYRILKGQGPKAKGGARSYLIGKRMVSGFALIAWPVSYGTTGVMSFIVNQDGAVFERDLGPRTQAISAGIRLFEPDDSWQPVKP